MAGATKTVPQKDLHEDCQLRLLRALTANPSRNTAAATAVRDLDAAYLQQEHRAAFEESLAAWVCRIVTDEADKLAKDASEQLFGHDNDVEFELRVQIVEVAR